MIYQSVQDFVPLAVKHGAAHRERLRLFHSRGNLLMAGPLEEPMNGDAIGLFTSREAAEEFVAGDPFVIKRRGGSMDHPPVDRLHPGLNSAKAAGAMLALHEPFPCCSKSIAPTP